MCRNILRLRILGLCVLRRWRLLCILRVDGLIRRRRRLRWFRVTTAKQAAQETCRMSGLASLLRLLLQLSNLSLRLFQRDVLNENCLRQDIKRVGIGAKRPIQQRFGVRVLFLELSLIDPLDERVEELFFLRSQGN